MSNEFFQRQAIIIDPKDANIEIIQPQLSVLVVDNPVNPGKRYLDVGALCYRRRIKVAPQQSGILVDESSLENARIPFARALIDELRLHSSIGSMILYFEKSRKFVDWLDAQEQPCFFDDVAAMKNAYFKYTNYLLSRMNSSGISERPIKQSTAASYQFGALIVMRITTNLGEPEIRGIATFIPYKIAQATHVSMKLPSADVQAQTFAALINFIDEAHRLLIENGSLPLHLKSPSGESCYLYSFQLHSAKYRNAGFSTMPLLLKSPEFPTWKQAKEHLGLIGNSAALKIERAIYDNTRTRYKKNNNDLRSHLRQLVGNHAVTVSMLAFIAATGCNLSIAQALEVDTLEVVPSTQGKRFSGTKARAGGKTVVPEFGIRFSPVFKKYLQLRDWVLNGSDSALVFPAIPIKSKYGISQVGENSIRAIKNIFAREPLIYSTKPGHSVSPRRLR